MDPRLAEMVDHYEITKTLREYCHACDRCDEPRMRAVYVEDSWDDHGDVKAPGAEFARIMTHAIRTTTTSLSHLLGQSMIKVNGDEAGAETYFIAVAKTVGEDGREYCNQLGGRFVDTLRRENGRWLIKHRHVVRDWSISLPIEYDWKDSLALTPGQRSNADPSCAVLGMAHSDGESPS